MEKRELEGDVIGFVPCKIHSAEVQIMDWGKTR